MRRTQHYSVYLFASTYIFYSNNSYGIDGGISTVKDISNIYKNNTTSNGKLVPLRTL